MRIKGDEYDYIVTPFQEKLGSILSLPYWAPWAVISGVLLGVHLEAGRGEGLGLSGWYAVIVSCSLPGLAAVATIWFSKALEQFTPRLFMFIERPKKDVVEWYEGEVRSIFSSLWMSVGGILLICLCLFCIKKGPLWKAYGISSWEVSKPLVIVIVTELLVGFLGGAMLYTMFGIGRMMHRLGKKEHIKVSVYHHPVTSVRAVGRLLTKISLVVVALYIFGISSSLCSESVKELKIYVVILVFAVVVTCFFIFPQIKIHQIMARVKHERLSEHCSRVEKALEKVKENPSRGNIEEVRELFEVQRSLKGVGEWPFDTRLLLTVLTGVAVPLMVVLLQLFFEWLRG